VLPPMVMVYDLLAIFLATLLAVTVMNLRPGVV
jgi:hypothetical protein